MMSPMTATHATAPVLTASEQSSGFTLVLLLVVILAISISYVSLRSKK